MKRVQSKKDKELADNAKLLRWWRAWHCEQREAVLAGPHGAVLSELLRMFANLQHVSPVQLIGFHARHRLGGDRFRHPFDRFARGQQRHHPVP
jgi:hypothetical protein